MSKFEEKNPDIKTIEDYIGQYEGEQKEWLLTFVTFMNKNYPRIEGKISYQMPMYKLKDCYIAFSVAKDHFSFHTLDFEMIEELHKLLTKAKFGKGCAKVKYADKEVIPILFNYCHKIIKKHS